MNLTLLLWTVGILSMWYDAQSTMRKRGREIVAGSRKAALELALAMMKELDVDYDDLKFLTEQDIKNRIAAVRGGSISYATSQLNEIRTPKTNIKEWFIREKWWILATVVTITFTCVIWMASSTLR